MGPPLEDLPRAFRLEVIAHVGDADHHTLSVYQVWIVGLPVLKIWPIFGHGVKRPGGFDLWPLNGVMGHLSWASSLPIFSILRPSILDLGWGTVQTDRQQPSMHYAPPYEAMAYKVWQCKWTGTQRAQHTATHTVQQSWSTLGQKISHITVPQQVNQIRWPWPESYFDLASRKRIDRWSISSHGHG